jgi:hypothetical protein
VTNTAFGGGKERHRRRGEREIKALFAASPGDATLIGRQRAVAAQKLPEIVALIERSEPVHECLECVSRCGCPSLDVCPLFA